MRILSSMSKTKKIIIGGSLVTAMAVVATAVTAPGKVQAVFSPYIGVHTSVRSATGDVFLGGNFIELGISKLGSFGTTEDYLPSNFLGGKDETSLGLATSSEGFRWDMNPDDMHRMDYVLPGTPESRWSVAYTEYGVNRKYGSNSLLVNATDMGGPEGPGGPPTPTADIADNVVTNTSSGTTLRAVSNGTFNKKLKINQIFSFRVNDRYIKNTVTVTNTSKIWLSNVRFMNSFDPDNTVDLDGDYSTRNTILYTNEAGDGRAAVVADTSNNNNDPMYLFNGSRSPFILYSTDSRARVSSYGFVNTNPYTPKLYDNAPSKGTTVNDDRAISINVDMGSLAPGGKSTFVYYISVDPGDPVAAIDNIRP